MIFYKMSTALFDIMLGITLIHEDNNVAVTVLQQSFKNIPTLKSNVKQPLLQ